MAAFSIISCLETLNFSETEVLWNRYPVLLRSLVIKTCMYLAVICVFLSGIQNVRYMFDSEVDAPDKFTAGYDVKVAVTFFVKSSHQLRDVFGVVPSDKTTRESIAQVNRRNYLVLFVLVNFYLWNSWVSLPANVVFILAAESLAGIQVFRHLNLAVHCLRFASRFIRPAMVDHQ
jgi:hypothetical protein